MTSTSSADRADQPRSPLDDLVPAWLSVPEVAERLGTAPSNVRGAFASRRIVGSRPGGHQGFRVPEAFLVPAHLANAADPGPAPEPGHEKEVILPSLQGTIVQLHDAGLTDDEIVAWLFTTNDDLGTTPVQALRKGHKSAVRRAAQLLD